MLKSLPWKEQLEQLLQTAEGREPTRIINDIRDLGVAMGHETGEALLEAYPELYAYQPVLTDAFRRMVNAQDIAETTQMLASDLGGASFRDVASAKTSIGVLSSMDAYNRLNEVFDHVAFEGRRRVVMVGCGRRPFTMFRIHDKTDVPEIIGLDIVPEAVDTANLLAGRLGYGRMRAELRDGRDYDYGEAQVVYVASMVSPKAEVVSRIAATAPPDAQIVLWEPYSLGRLWAESAERTLDPRLEAVSRTSVSRNMTRDVILRRRTRAAATGRRG